MDYAKLARRVKNRVSLIRKKAAPTLSRGINKFKTILANKGLVSIDNLKKADFDKQDADKKIWTAESDMRKIDPDSKEADIAHGDLKSAEGDKFIADKAISEEGGVLATVEKMENADPSIATGDIVREFKDISPSGGEELAEVKQATGEIDKGAELNSDLEEGKDLSKKLDEKATPQQEEVEAVLLEEKEEKKDNLASSSSVINEAFNKDVPKTPESAAIPIPGANVDLASGPSAPTTTSTGSTQGSSSGGENK